MDAIVGAVFRNKIGPLFKIQSNQGTFTTYRETFLQVLDLGYTECRRFSIKQKMTWCGLTEAEYLGTVSNYEGICDRFYVGPQQLDMEAVQQAIIVHGMNGLRDNHVELMLNFMRGWGDNHVALILNCMRFTHLLDVYSNALGRQGQNMFEAYNDGRVHIQTNDIWEDKPGYEEHWEPQWPGGNLAENYPKFITLLSYKDVDMCTECIDLTQLGDRDVEIMLMMTGAWERRSRYKLDFSLPRLADKIAFRSSDASYRMSTSWQRKGDQEPTTEMPDLPTSDEIWRAMIEYVTTNRLHAHFTVAVYLFCTTACQYVPGTAEQSIWNEVTTRLAVPKFQSIRGRYAFFNWPESSAINARAMNEWIYIGKEFRKLQSLSVLVCQAMWFGLGVRNMRRGIEFDQLELDSTAVAFMGERYVASAAIAEALRIKVPLSGMSGISVWFDGWQEDPFAEPRMLQTNILDDKELKNYDLVEDGDQTYLRVHEFNLPGIPVYLLPLPDIVPGLKIFSGEGSFKPSDGEFVSMGWKLPYYKAYELAVISKFCGFKPKLGPKDRFRGPKKFHAPRDSEWIQPHSFYDRGMPTYFGGVNQGDRLFIQMPDMESIDDCREVAYKLRFSSRGIYRGELLTRQRYTKAKSDITEPDENALIGIRISNQPDEPGEHMHISRADAMHILGESTEL